MTHTNGTAHGGSTPLFEIDNLHVSVEGREILRGVNLTICPGEVHALMGRNGSGKSTLANALMGHPKYAVTSGSVRLDGEDILGLKPDERARLGLFLAFQNPTAIPGRRHRAIFCRAAVKAVRGTESINAVQFRKELTERMQHLQMDSSFATRALNEGFSGGEKKRAEMLQLAMLKPRLAILDEPDSGLDIDAVRIVSDGINCSASAATRDWHPADHPLPANFELRPTGHGPRDGQGPHCGVRWRRAGPGAGVGRLRTDFASAGD